MLRSINHLTRYRAIQWLLKNPYINKLARLSLSIIYAIIERDIFIINLVIVIWDVLLDTTLCWFDAVYRLVASCFRFLFAIAVDLSLHLVLFGYWIANLFLIPVRILSSLFNYGMVKVLNFVQSIVPMGKTKVKDAVVKQNDTADKGSKIENIRMSNHSPKLLNSSSSQSIDSSHFSTPPPPVINTSNNNLEIAMKNTATPTLLEVKDNVSVDYVNKITNIWEPIENDIANTTASTKNNSHDTNTAAETNINPSNDGSSIHTSTHTSTHTSINSERSNHQTEQTNTE